ncbi:MAG: hypothetical protein PHW54_04535 [Candidatus Omnitrophica bacterium]|jgi:hypothetical protein|nr:hypothetical protein [Candidatus Omnitrophota bacterium]
MNRKGLCSTCAEIKTCIFTKEPPVWQCEEFSGGNNHSALRQGNVKRVIREEVTESE